MSDSEQLSQDPNNTQTQEAAQVPSAVRAVPDPGSPGVRLIALIVLLAGVLSVAVMQQLSLAQMSEQETEQSTEVGITPPSSSDPHVLMSKMAVKVGVVFGESESAAPLLQQVESVAFSGAELMRAGVVAHELGLSEQGDGLLDRAMAADADPVLEADVGYVRSVYAGLAGDVPEAFVDRHGWFAELVTTASLPEGDASRDALRSGGGLLVFFLLGGFVLVVAALVVGVGLLITAVVLFATGSPIVRARFVPPSVGGSVYLESAAIFAFGFLIVQLLGGVFSRWLPESTLLLVSIGMQWLLLLVPAWPLARGVSLQRLRADLGLTAPRGVFRELAAGLAMYLAWIPVFVSVAVVSAMLMILTQSGSAEGGSEPPSNPVIDLLSGADAFGLVLFASLAVVWAPLVEELVFRGCLYRHARARVGMVIAAVLTAGAFGVMHGYHFIMLMPVISLGVLFALMREWRGSLIGPMFAHFLHNGTLIGLLIGIFTQLG